MRNILHNLNNNKNLKQYLLTGMLFLIVAVLVCAYEDLVGRESAKEVCRVLSNAFFVPGIVIGGIGVLSWIASEGNFDMLAFSFTNFSLHNLIPTLPEKEKKYKDFYEYKEHKDEKRADKSNKANLIIGLVGIVIGVIFTILYSIL